ncbi:MAG: DUF1036 domain-containing protein [Hyphomicrobium sp.]|nr:DUF1036 domain-containing protein [Hyphomicrobium sp.]
MGAALRTAGLILSTRGLIGVIEFWNGRVRRTAWALGLALCLPGAHDARADLKLCNSTSSRIGVAVGYQDNTGWATEGWWNIASQTCETLLKGPVPSRFVYVHAVDYDRGGEWGGKNEMCTADKSFAIRGVQDCAKRGYKRTGFFEVDTGEAKEWTIRLTDPDAQGSDEK